MEEMKWRKSSLDLVIVLEGLEGNWVAQKAAFVTKDGDHCININVNESGEKENFRYLSQDEIENKASIPGEMVAISLADKRGDFLKNISIKSFLYATKEDLRNYADAVGELYFSENDAEFLDLKVKIKS